MRHLGAENGRNDVHESFVADLRPRSDSGLLVGAAVTLEPRATAPHSAEAARHIVEALVEAGSNTFFGIPGGPIAPLFDAILRTSGARLVRSRHEAAAAFEAAGYYRATGEIPVVVVTSGPGVTNALTGVASAHYEAIPMLVVCGDVAWAADGKRLLQDSGPERLDVERIYASVTRATIRVAHARSAATQAIAALDAAADPLRPGPSLLVVPIQHATVRVGRTRIERAVVRRRREPTQDLVAEVFALLGSAQRPLVVVGAGCRPYAEGLRRMLDVLDVPFVTTPRAKGLVSERHPCSLRHGGLAASYWARAYTAGAVDAALVLGTDLDDCSVGPTRYVSPGGRLVHVDTDPSVFHRNLPADIAITADVSNFIDAMAALATGAGRPRGFGTALVQEVRKATPAFENPEFAANEAPVLRPDRAIADLEKMWARSMGIVGLRVDHPGELTPERLESAVESGGPVILDMRIDPDVRLAGAGRIESLQQMSTPSSGAVS